MRRRLGLAINNDGPDPFGHQRLADTLGGRTHARHRSMISVWRQVLSEAGAVIPDRNIERLLRTTHVAVPEGDGRRMDIVATGLNVEHGLPLFCDVTVVTPIARNGRPRPGTSNSGGSLLLQAERDNNNTYAPVLDSGLGALFSLGFEVYGRWARQCSDLLPKLAWERARFYSGRLKRGIALGLQNRWSGLLAVTLQKAVAAAATRDEGGDLDSCPLERAPSAGTLHFES